jgi:hypothetical protein
MVPGAAAHTPDTSTSDQQCTANSGTARTAAASNPNSSAASLNVEPSTPTTTGPDDGGTPSTVDECITTTGQCPCPDSATATEPTSSEPNPPRPRDPSTINWAEPDSLISSSATIPLCRSVINGIPGAFRCAAATASVSQWRPWARTAA